MPVKKRLRVFLSSALDDDVRAERAAVKAAIEMRDYEADFVGVERWAATGASPLARSLEELDNCDVYVGVFAIRCGAITMDEYEFAKERAGIARLLFFRKLRPGEADAVADGDGKLRVDKIRKDVENPRVAPTYAIYDDPNHLRALVGEALGKESHRRASSEPLRVETHQPPTRYLATLCDRDDQQPRIDEVLTGALRDRSRALVVYALQGDDDEDHEAFVEWYHYLRLNPEYGSRKDAGKSNVPSRGNIMRCEWRTDNAPLADRHLRMLRDFAGELVDAREVPTTEPELISTIVQALNAARQHITVRYHLRSADLRADDDQLLRRWLDTLLALPLTSTGSLISVMFCFRRQSKLLRLLSPGARRLQRSFEMMRTLAHPSVVALPALQSPTENHAIGWAETRCFKYYTALDRDVLKKTATKSFSAKRKSALPFADVKPDLEEALDAAYRAYRPDRI